MLVDLEVNLALADISMQLLRFFSNSLCISIKDL